MPKGVLTMWLFIRKVRTNRMFVVLEVHRRTYLIAQLRQLRGDFYVNTVPRKIPARKPQLKQKVLPGDFIYHRRGEMKLIKIIRPLVAEE